MKRLFIFAMSTAILGCNSKPLSPSVSSDSSFPNGTQSNPITPKTLTDSVDNLIADSQDSPNPSTSTDLWSFPNGVFPNPTSPPPPRCILQSDKAIYEAGEKAKLTLVLTQGPAYSAAIMKRITSLPSGTIELELGGIGTNVLGGIVIGPYDFAVCEVSVFVVPKQSELDFGGMWGYVNGVISKNPLTDGEYCPPGFTANSVKGTHGHDWPIILCSRVHKPGVDSPLDFGGMYGYVNALPVPNPLTGSQSCPPGFSGRQVSGTPNLDYNTTYCYRLHVPGAPVQWSFGGMWGYAVTAPGVESLMVNPATGGAHCPGGHTAHKVGGTLTSIPNDGSLYFCSKTN